VTQPVTTGTEPGKIATPSKALADSIRAELEKPTSGSVSVEPVKVGRPFRIGFLSVSGGGAQDYEWYRQIQNFLREDKVLRKAMEDEGVTDLHLRQCDGPEDMLQRMGQAEFDLVFCPAMVYVQDRIARTSVYDPPQGKLGPDRYLVLFKMMRSSEDKGDGRGQYIRRTGVLFKRNTPALQKKSVKSLFSDPSSVLVVSGAHDAAGYFYVRKMLWEEYEQCSPKFLFCGSPQNVVKAVVSGLCDVGACEESVLREMLEELNGGKKLSRLDDSPYITVINQTQSVVPADPILIRSAYEPGMNGSSVGLRVRQLLQGLYNSKKKSSPSPSKFRIVSADAEPEKAYKDMVNDVKLTKGYAW
jgi:hypothetical protein